MESKKLQDASNPIHYETNKSKTSLIAPVAALDNFFGNLKVPFFLDSREQIYDGNDKKTAKVSVAVESKNEKARSNLIAPVIAADNFFKNLQSASIFGPVDQVAVPEVEKSTSDLIQHNAKFEITNALLDLPAVRVASKRALASSKSLEIIAVQKNTTSNFSINTGIFPNGGKTTKTGFTTNASRCFALAVFAVRNPPITYWGKG